MNSEDQLQQNIRRTAGAHALRQIRAIVDEENKNDVAATADRAMNSNDPLQQNIRRTAGIHALRQIRAIVDEENKNAAATARALRWIGWFVLLLVVAVLARLIGVY
jgi:hypothetical protein